VLSMDDNTIPLRPCQIKRPLETPRRWSDQERDRHTETEDTVYKIHLSKDKDIWRVILLLCLVPQSDTITFPYFDRYCMFVFSFWHYSPNFGCGLPPWNSPFHFGLLDLRHSIRLLGRVISSSQGLYPYKNRKTWTRECTHACTHWH
jgi:hypothetical protein